MNSMRGANKRLLRIRFANAQSRDVYEETKLITS